MGYLRITGGAGIAHTATNRLGELIIGATGTTALTVGRRTGSAVDTETQSRSSFTSVGTTQIFIIDQTLPAEATTATYTSANVSHSAGESSTWTKTNATTGAGTSVGDFFTGAATAVITTNGSPAQRGLLITYNTTGARSTALGSLDLGGHFTIRVTYTTGTVSETIPIASIQAGMQYVFNEGETLNVPSGTSVSINTTPHQNNSI